MNIMPPVTPEPINPQSENVATGTAAPAEAPYRKLGHKAFYLLTLKKSAVAVCFLILEIALLVVQASGVLRAQPQIAGMIGGAELIVFIIFLVALIAGLLAGYFSYAAFRYRVDQNGFLIERGIVGNQETSLPFRQIQNVDIEQSIIYRMMGVCDLIILTAGHEDKQYASKNESEIVLPALDIRAARELRKYLLERANVQQVTPERTGANDFNPNYQ